MNVIEISNLKRQFKTTIGVIKRKTKEVVVVDGISSTRLIVVGVGMVEILPLLLEEFLIGLIFTLLGFFLFSTFKKQTKKSGTLEIF